MCPRAHICINVAPAPCRKTFSHGLDPNRTSPERTSLSGMRQSIDRFGHFAVLTWTPGNRKKFTRVKNNPRTFLPPGFLYFGKLSQILDHDSTFASLVRGITTWLPPAVGRQPPGRRTNSQFYVGTGCSGGFPRRQSNILPFIQSGGACREGLSSLLGASPALN